MSGTASISKAKYLIHTVYFIYIRHSPRVWNLSFCITASLAPFSCAMKLQCYTGLHGPSAQQQMPHACNRQAFSVRTRLCFSVLLLVTWSTVVCRSSNCGLVTPDLVQRKNEKSVHLPKAAISKTRKRDGCGQAGNKEKQWQYWSVRLCTPLRVVFSCLLHSEWGLWRGYLYAGWLSFALG